MFDPSADESPVFDYDELADHLIEQGLDASPSQLHGCLCGLLSAGAPAEAEAGLDLLEQALELAFHGELAAELMRLYSVSAAALEDEEFDFHPLLPDDEQEIGLRTAALSEWVRGFLDGFAQANRRDIAGESGEILADFAAIAEASAETDADEEESEGSYAELVEYLRFAALNLFMDHRIAVEDGAGERSLH